MKHRVRLVIIAIATPFVAAGCLIGLSSLLTERDIAAHEQTVMDIARRQAITPVSPEAMAALPVPVRRYLDFAVPDLRAEARMVRLTAEGSFRRPQTESFAPTTAAQTIAIRTPALMFAATTPILPGLWARAYDFFAEGHMEMRAKLASTITVVNERETEALNRTSLRRWLLESPLYPAALLPGGPVRWEAMNETQARAIVSGFGLQASMIATFRPDGALARLDAEEDGDLTTPYHGSGEHAARDDYRRVGGMMIPHAFTIARAAQGKIFPFWSGRVTSIAFE